MNETLKIVVLVNIRVCSYFEIKTLKEIDYFHPCGWIIS
jgi:hypothetical protein